MYQKYKDILEGKDSIQKQLNLMVNQRDRLIMAFDTELGGLKLPMRLRKRSGGLLSWRNIALRGQDQRDRDLSGYTDQLVRLPQAINRQLLDFEKQRLLINLNLSTLQHEKKQLDIAIKKIDDNTSLIESMVA